ncbi:MAG TPA: ATP-binding cassette domain-containing protein [Gemmatimonadaceae bacterium]|nr:ATP-binding cassette domain-containing protein [Gemmatimonadaceae bacterium]
MSHDVALSISHLSKSYRAGVLGCTATVDVLRGLSLELPAGQLVTVEGARGAGKTTLLLCAAGMLRPDEGIVEWPSLPKRNMRPPSGIAYAADRAPMYGFLTIRESLAYAATVRELHEPGAARDTDELLDVAWLRDLADTRVGLLSATERARLIIALALVQSPRLLLIDDLCGSCDAVGRAEFVKCVARVASNGAAVLWAGRAIGVVSDATRAYVMTGGKLRFAGATHAPKPDRVTIELDVPAPAAAAAMLAPRVQSLRYRAGTVRVPLDGRSAEEVLALCRDLAIPVRASRVVREPGSDYRGARSEHEGRSSEVKKP